jgi:hypothetical protein
VVPVLVLDLEPITINIRDGEKGPQIVDVVSGIWGSSNSRHVVTGVTTHFSRYVVHLFWYDRKGESQ